MKITKTLLSFITLFIIFTTYSYGDDKEKPLNDKKKTYSLDDIFDEVIRNQNNKHRNDKEKPLNDEKIIDLEETITETGPCIDLAKKIKFLAKKHYGITLDKSLGSSCIGGRYCYMYFKPRACPYDNAECVNPGSIFVSMTGKDQVYVSTGFRVSPKRFLKICCTVLMTLTGMHKDLAEEIMDLRYKETLYMKGSRKTICGITISGNTNRSGIVSDMTFYEF